VYDESTGNQSETQCRKDEKDDEILILMTVTVVRVVAERRSKYERFAQQPGAMGTQEILRHNISNKRKQSIHLYSTPKVRLYTDTGGLELHLFPRGSLAGFDPLSS
jgi:hypothetical protein